MPPKCMKCGFYHSYSNPCERPKRSITEELNYMVIKKGDDAYRFFFGSEEDASKKAKEFTASGQGSFMVYELIESHTRIQPETYVETTRRK